LATEIASSIVRWTVPPGATSRCPAHLIRVFLCLFSDCLVYQFDFQFFLLQPCTHTFNGAVGYLIDGLQIEIHGIKNKEKFDLLGKSTVKT
jgi:hypothetical protein